MKIAIRADASLVIGFGHVMRCLTLAVALREKQGAEVVFLCREHEGNLNTFIIQRGFQVHVLPVNDLYQSCDEQGYADWLGVSWEDDAKQCEQYLSTLKPDWLIVDHYALDACWEKSLASYCKGLLVIDDLASRSHHCDILLDQTLGRSEGAYQNLVPVNCKLLIGTTYALLRPEFANLREYSLKRRISPQLKQLLITMGGVDQQNATARVLEGLRGSSLPEDCHIIIVLAAISPCLKLVQEQAADMQWKTSVLVDVTNMAEIMADSDLAIGAAGSTSWERCCLGLPTLLVTLADNQIANAQAQNSAQAVRLLGHINDIVLNLSDMLDMCMKDLARMSATASQLCDGDGVAYVLDNMQISSDR